MVEHRITEGIAFPKQKVPYSQKTEEWKKQCVDGVINHCNTYQSKRRSSFKQKRRNYELFNNKINRADFNYVLNPFNLPEDKAAQMQMPASLQPYDVLSPIFMFLFGEEMKRFFSPIVMAVNSESIDAKLQKRQELVLQKLREYLTDEQMSEEFLAQALAKYQNYNPTDARESQASHLLKYIQKSERTDITFNECWKDSLLVGEGIADPCEIAGVAKLRRVNPLEISFDLPTNSSYIDDCTKAYEKNRMSVPEIIDEFYEDLTEAQIDDLEAFGSGAANTFYNYNFNQVPIVDYFGDGFITSGVGAVNSIDDLADSSHYINVHRTRWKSYRKIGILHYLDEFNKEQTIHVDELFKFNKKDPDKWIEWLWITEAWEGVRIGQDMYLKMRPRKNQFRSLSNLSECKLGYTGTVYSALNTQSISLMDRLVPWLYLYLVMWYRTELLIAANQGKIALIDMSLIPDGWEPEKWLYYASAMKIGFTDSFKESLKRYGGGQNQSTQNKSLDLAQGSEIQYHIQILEFIEKKIEDTSGVPRQRKGEISASEKVGNTERVVQQSSTMTEPYHAVHSEFKLRALEAVIKVAQDIIDEKGDKAYMYVKDDMSTAMGMIDSEDFPNADFQLFLSNSRKDHEVLQFFQDHISEALQNDKIEYSQIADLVGSDSIADSKAGLKKAEQERKQSAEQQAQADRDLQMQMHKETMDFEREKLDREDANKAADRETDILVAELKAVGSQSINEPDADANGIPDVMEIGKLALEQTKHSNEVLLKGQELEHKRTESMKAHQIKEKELALKRQELLQKAKETKEKIKVERENMKNDEKIAKINLKGRANKPKPKK